MGDAYLYVNLDRKEFLRADALGGSGKIASVGRTLSARALGLLLAGVWSGGRIAAVSESDPLFATHNFADVREEAVRLLLARDGADELLDVAEHDVRVFELLRGMAIAGRSDALGFALAERFGRDWKKSREVP